MTKFDELWDFIVKRSAAAAMPVVQEKKELEHVFYLLEKCTSYLEVGTAEGNSMYVLANAMPKGSEITYIDFGEKHTEKNRNFILDKLSDYNITPIHGDSNDYSTFRKVANKRFDAVLIDAGHTDFNVAIDCLFYGPLASKYIIFHDVQLPDVGRAFDWYCKQFPERNSYRVVASANYGFGVIEV